eukprot:gene16048-22184_t
MLFFSLADHLEMLFGGSGLTDTNSAMPLEASSTKNGEKTSISLRTWSLFRKEQHFKAQQRHYATLRLRYDDRHKVDAIRNGTAMVLECRRKMRYDDMVMDAAAKLLKVVPEIYTIWNYRREALAPAFEAGGDAAQKASNGELALTQACLADNPKSYSTWHHRKWIVLKGYADLQAELELIGKALEADERNFHAWNYRQFLVKLLGRSPETELEYADEKMVMNFSNYSAWHYRTILLNQICSASPAGEAAAPDEEAAASGNRPAPASSAGEAAAPAGGAAASGNGPAPASPVGEAAMPDQGAAASGKGPAPRGTLGAFTGSASQSIPVPVEVLDEEYDMVHQAFATDGGDQSPWMYYRWLVGNSLAHLQVALGTPEEEDARVALQAVLEREISRLQEDHLQDCPDSKWPLLTVARLKEAQARMKLCEAGEEEKVLLEVRDIYVKLMTLDPMRKGFYQDALDGKAFVVVQALGTV